MNPEFYERFRHPFNRAFDLRGEARAAFLDELGRADTDLRRAVERALAECEDRLTGEGCYLDIRDGLPQKPDHGEQTSDAPQASPSDQVQNALASSVSNDSATNATVSAPSFPGPPPPKPQNERHALARLAPGTVIGGFQIVRWLGGGAAGDVYLAREQSVGLRVALKVTHNIGTEARTMAMLEHRHIVQVFWQDVEESCDARLISMQYVPGATLGEVLSRLRSLPREQHCGQALLAAVSSASEGELTFDAEAARDRDLLAAAGYLDAVCWLVARLAEALDFAHQKNIRHRDVKPANILINYYGRPLLADFSVSSAPQASDATEKEIFGGTVEYMAPEHLLAFDARTFDTVDERCDIYSLGVVLYELIALKLPHVVTDADKRDAVAREALANRKLSPPPRLRESWPETPYALEYATCKCLAADPAQRYAKAGQLAGALEGCRQLEQVQKRLPRTGVFAGVVARAPVLTVMGIGFLPHMLGTLYNPAYNALILFPRYSPEQRVATIVVALLYGCIVFPPQIAFVLNRNLPIWRVWRRLKGDSAPRAAEVNDARKRLLNMPMMAVKLAITGWLPLIAVIPLAQHQLGAGFTWVEYAHFAVSVLLCFLLASTYSYFALQYVVVCLAYPEFWADATYYSKVSRSELSSVTARLRWFQAGAFLPLIGGILILLIGPQAFAAGSYLAFARLMICLIVLSMAGAFLSIHVGGLISKSVDVLSVDGVGDHP